MSLETRWSEPALLSLAEVLEYTLEEHGELQYTKMRKQIMDAVRKISVSPYSAPIEPCSEKVGVELRGYLVISKIKIIYSVVDNILYIEYKKTHGFQSKQCSNAWAISGKSLFSIIFLKLLRVNILRTTR